MKVTAIIVCTIAAVFLKLVDARIYRRYPDDDCPNNDISGSPWPNVPSEDGCRTLCEDEGTCRGFVYITDNTKRCYLKTRCDSRDPKNNHVSFEAITKSGHVSGYDKYNNLDCKGSDILPYPYYENRDMLAECINWCNSRSNCKGLVYTATKCYLKSECSVMTNQQGFFTYVKTSAVEVATSSCTENTLVNFEDCTTECSVTSRTLTNGELGTALDHSDCMADCYKTQHPPIAQGSMESEVLLNMSDCGTKCYRRYLTDSQAASGDDCKTAQKFYNYDRCFGVCVKNITLDNGSRSKRDLRVRRANTEESLSHDRVIYLDCYVECVMPPAGSTGQCKVMDFINTHLCNIACLKKVDAVAPSRAKRAATNHTLTKLNVKNAHCISDCLVEVRHDACLLLDLEAVKTCFNACVTS